MEMVCTHDCVFYWIAIDALFPQLIAMVLSILLSGKYRMIFWRPLQMSAVHTILFDWAKLATI
jgi:hypothetical protein